MFWKLRNRYVQILAKNGVSLENRKKFLKNADDMGIFDDSIENDFELELEKEANSFCKNKKKVFLGSNKNIILEINERVLKEQEERIIINMDKIEKDEEDRKSIFRYGRNKLHEAIMLKDIDAVKEYSKNDDLIHQKDNNNLTPVELAYYEDFTEAFEFLNNLLEAINK